MSYEIIAPALVTGGQPGGPEEWGVCYKPDLPWSCVTLETRGVVHLSPKDARGLAIVLLSYADKAEAEAAQEVAR